MFCAMSAATTKQLQILKIITVIEIIAIDYCYQLRNSNFNTVVSIPTKSTKFEQK